MSTLVQPNNSLHYPQSTVMNSGEGTARQQRPSNNPSKNLLPNELHSLYDILGHNRVTLATAVAQVLHGYNGTWRKQACGVFCFVKDYDNRSYCFRLYDLRSRQAIYEETVPASLRLEKALDVFYTFDGSNCKIGINFVDRDEAQTFSHHFHSKQEDRQKKKKSNVPMKTSPSNIHPPTSSPAMQTLVNGIKPPPPATIAPPSQHVIPPTVTTSKKTSTTKNPGYFTLGRSKKKTTRLDISAPIPSTWVHVNHIGTKGSFFNDDEQKQLFENVLAGLHISPEEKLYVREIVNNTDGGFEKLLSKPTPPVRDLNNQGQQQTSGGPPVIPPRSYPTVGRNNGGRTPHQDVSVPPPASNQSSGNRSAPLQGLFNPPAGHNQPPAPIIPPRPGPRAPDNAYPSTQAPPAPPPPPPIPPPMPHSGGSSNDSHRAHAPPAPPPPPPPPPFPNNFMNQGPGGSFPPPPPPPPPSGLLLTSGSGSTTNSSSKGGPDTRDKLLEDIRSGTFKFKKQSERPALPEVSSASGTSPGEQDTMAINILKILAERREKLIGPEVENDSDSSDGEWSN